MNPGIRQPKSFSSSPEAPSKSQTEGRILCLKKQNMDLDSILVPSLEATLMENKTLGQKQVS